MMDVFAQMDADLDTSFLSTFGTAGTYKAQGAATTFPVTLAVGDPPPTVQLNGGLTTVDRSTDATGKLDVLRAGILATTTVDRDPSMGDTWTVATGALRGEWAVESCHPDEGGGCTVRLRWREVAHVGAGVQQ